MRVCGCACMCGRVACGYAGVRDIYKNIDIIYSFIQVETASGEWRQAAQHDGPPLGCASTLLWPDDNGRKDPRGGGVGAEVVGGGHVLCHWAPVDGRGCGGGC